MTIIRRLSVTLLLAAVITTISAPPAAAQYLDTYESQIITSSNAQRNANKMASLKANACIDGFAERHAAYMARTRKFVHQDLRKIMTTCKLSRAGENIAYGSTGPFPNGGKVVTAWMNSPGHRANILNWRFKLIGVGAGKYVSGSDQVRYFSQVFGTAK